MKKRDSDCEENDVEDIHDKVDVQSTIRRALENKEDKLQLESCNLSGFPDELQQFDCLKVYNLLGISFRDYRCMEMQSKRYQKKYSIHLPT